MNWRFDLRCDKCGKFVSSSRPGTGWEACGEYGEDTRYVCATCLAGGARLMASNGLSDARWCGVTAANPVQSDADDAPGMNQDGLTP